jgi:hypothetical protein
MSKRKRNSKVVLKLTKQQIELAEIQYWKRYNNYKQNEMLNG